VRVRHALPLALLALALALGVALWQFSPRPALWLALLNRQLPPDLSVEALAGLRFSTRHLHIGAVRLRWQDHRIDAHHLNLDFAVTSWWPLTAQLQHVDAATVDVALAAPTEPIGPADPQPFPRFWQLPAWSWVTSLSGDLGHWRVRNPAATLDASGTLRWIDGFTAGTVAAAVGATSVDVAWQRDGDAPPQWLLQWRAAGSASGTGTLALAWLDGPLEFTLEGAMEALLPDHSAVSMVRLQAHGQAHLFDADPLRAEGSWHGAIDTAFGDLGVSAGCAGQFSATEVDAPAMWVSECDVTSDEAGGTLRGTVMVAAGPTASWQWHETLEVALWLPLPGPQPVHATLQIAPAECQWGTSCDVQLAAAVSDGEYAGWTWRALEFRTSLAVDEAAVRLGASHVAVAAAESAEWRLQALTIEIAPLQAWAAGMQGWEVADVAASAQLAPREGDWGASITTRLTALQIADASSVSGNATVDVLPRWPGLALPLVRTQQTLVWRDGSLAAEGAVAVGSLEPLAHYALTLAAGTDELRVSAVVDGRAWPADTELLAVLLGPEQDLLPLQSLYAVPQLRMTAQRIAGAVQVGVRGQVDSVRGVAGEAAAFDGATLRPLALDWSPGQWSAALSWQLPTINIGLLLQDVRGDLVVDAAGWSVQAATGQVLGGRFSLDTLGSATPRGLLRLEDIDLAATVGLLKQPELQVTGSFTGSLPLLFEAGALSVRQGTVRGTVPGIIQYKPAGGGVFAAHPQMAAVGVALQNLHYEVLEAEATYAAEGDLLLATRLIGRNPEQSGSRPIHLNLNVEQNVLDLLRSLRAADDVSAWLERRLGGR